MKVIEKEIDEFVVADSPNDRKSTEKKVWN